VLFYGYLSIYFGAIKISEMGENASDINTFSSLSILC